MNTNVVLGDKELWVEAHLVMQVFCYNDSGEEDLNYVVDVEGRGYKLSYNDMGVIYMSHSLKAN